MERLGSDSHLLRFYRVPTHDHTAFMPLWVSTRPPQEREREIDPYDIQLDALTGYPALPLGETREQDIAIFNWLQQYANAHPGSIAVPPDTPGTVQFGSLTELQM